MAIYAQIACDLPRDPKMLQVGWQTRAVYVEAVLFARENLTDGELIRVALPLWMHDMNPKTRTKHLDRLADVGALQRTNEGWRFPDKVWRKWNPTRSEVEEKREAERQRKAEYRRQRQRVRDVSQECPNGTDADVPGVSQARPRQPEPEPEPKEKPEPEPKEKPSGTRSSSTHLAAPNGRTTTTKDHRFETVVDLIAERQIQEHGTTPRVNAERYRSMIVNRLIANHRDTVSDYLSANPDHPAQLAADRLYLTVEGR